jgi:hypothetical protein
MEAASAATNDDAAIAAGIPAGRELVELAAGGG